MAVQLVGIGLGFLSVGVSLTPTTLQMPWRGESLFGIGQSIPASNSGIISFVDKYALFAPNNPVAWPVGTATANGIGTPSWSLTDDDGGNFQIDSATGIVSKLTASTLTTATHTITISVSGLTPSPPEKAVSFPVAPSLDFSQPGNSGMLGQFP